MASEHSTHELPKEPDGKHYDNTVASEDLFRSVFEHSPNGIAVARQDGRISRVNPAFCRLVQCHEDELRELSILDVTAHADRRAVAKLLQTARLCPERPQELDKRLTRKDGDVIPVHARVTWIPDASGRPAHACFLFEDLSSREPTERAQTRESQPEIAHDELSRAIMATALDAILTIAEDGSLTSLNPRAEELFDMSQKEAVGQDIGLLIPASRASGDRLFDGIGPELEGRRPNGSLFPIHLSLTQMQVGNQRGYCVCIRDLTEARQIQGQLRQSQKMEAVGSLASGVAHDFNNLLMGMSGCACAALDCIETNASARMYLAEIKKAAESGTAMTQQLLAFSRKADLEFVVFEIDAAIAAQESLLRRLLGEDIALSVQLDAADSRVRADIGQLDQVLMNLAVNARDAMPNGGRLTIATSTVALEDPPLQGEEDRPDLPAGQYVALSVADEGCGMSAETRKHLFERFYTTKEAGKGTGLGLATVNRIIMQFHGHIEVHSAEGQGTRFEILLPLIAGERSARQRPTEVRSDEPGHGTVLLCEDDRLVRMAIRYYLEGAGYRVLNADSGADVIRCCRNFPHPIDLLLTDIVLPDQSGDRAATEARQLKPGLKVLYMSAHASAWLKSKGRIDHELEMLQKPFDEQSLLATVRKVLGDESRSAAASPETGPPHQSRPPG